MTFSYKLPFVVVVIRTRVGTVVPPFPLSCGVSSVFCIFAHKYPNDLYTLLRLFNSPDSSPPSDCHSFSSDLMERIIYYCRVVPPSLHPLCSARPCRRTKLDEAAVLRGNGRLETQTGGELSIKTWGQLRLATLGFARMAMQMMLLLLSVLTVCAAGRSLKGQGERGRTKREGDERDSSRVEYIMEPWQRI